MRIQVLQMQKIGTSVSLQHNISWCPLSLSLLDQVQRKCTGDLKTVGLSRSRSQRHCAVKGNAGCTEPAGLLLKSSGERVACPCSVTGSMKPSKLKQNSTGQKQMMSFSIVSRVCSLLIGFAGYKGKTQMVLETYSFGQSTLGLYKISQCWKS